MLFSATMVERGKPFPDLFLHAAASDELRAARLHRHRRQRRRARKPAIAAGMRVFSYHGDPHSDRDGLAAAGGILFDDMRKLAALVPIH